MLTVRLQGIFYGILEGREVIVPEVCVQESQIVEVQCIRYVEALSIQRSKLCINVVSVPQSLLQSSGHESVGVGHMFARCLISPTPPFDNTKGMVYFWRVNGC